METQTNPTMTELLTDYLEDFKIDQFFSGLRDSPNDEPFYFASTVQLIQYSNFTPAGVHVWSWLKEHDIKAKAGKLSQGNSESHFIIFSTLADRVSFTLWYQNNEINKVDQLYPNASDLLAFISSAQHGYYLSSGHIHESSRNYLLFHWLRTNVKSGLFYVDKKFFFTNQDDELQYTLRWKNVEPAE